LTFFTYDLNFTKSAIEKLMTADSFFQDMDPKAFVAFGARCTRRLQHYLGPDYYGIPEDRGFRDADLILDLLVRGDFPRIHRYSAESREVLQQLRYRQRLVKMRTMVVNSLLFLASSRGVTLRRQLQSHHFRSEPEGHRPSAHQTAEP